MKRPPKSKVSKPWSQRDGKITRRDKQIILLWLGGLFILAAVSGHIITTQIASRNLEQVIKRWKTEYNLNSDQSELIKEIERRFHGGGNPYLQPTRGTQEVREHHQEIASLMNPADGQRFLRAQEGHGAHPQPSSPR